MNATIEKGTLNPVRGFQHLSFSGFRLNKFGFEDPTTGEWYAPTFSYVGQLTAQRTDGTFVFANVSIPKDAWQEANTQELFSCISAKVEQALEFLETLRECACTATSKCTRHQ